MEIDRQSGKTRTVDQIIKEYDDVVNEEWTKDDKLAD